MSGSGTGPDISAIALGFLVFMLVLTEMHGFSTVGAIFAIPAVIFGGLLIILSSLLGLLTSFFIGGLSGGLFGLLLLAVALVWTRKSLVGFSAQNYMLFAIFIIMMLLIV